MSIVIFVVILLVLVLVHEFGHFFTAKKFGIKVDEFGFGFPPKLFGIKKGETEYTFNLLPIGGFVKIFGEDPNTESTSGPDSARSFISKPKWQQAIVLLAGVFANFLLAWLIFSFCFVLGFPDSSNGINLVKLSIFPAFFKGMSLTVSIAKDTIIGLYTLIIDAINGRGSLASITGPVGMVGIVGDAYKFGFVYLLSFAALISINLAIINLLPFPALDGGRLFFLLIEKIKGSRLNPKVINITNMIGFSILILLMVVVTYHDVVKLF